MGTIEKPNKGLGDALYSKTQQQVLGLLFGNPERSYYAKEIVRSARVGIGTVHRELEKLSSAGLLTVKNIGNQKHYQANSNSPIFEELRGIVLKTFGVADVLRQALAPFADKVILAFIYGSIAKGSDTSDSDIDVLIISDEISYSDIYASLTEYENRLGRDVNPTVYDKSEFQQKLVEDNHFLKNVLDLPKIMLVGSKDDIAKIRKSGSNRTIKMATYTMDTLVEKNREQILSLARENGIRNVRVFGSMARNEANEDSDLDLLVELEEGRSGFALGGFLEAVSNLIHRKVDIVTEKALHPAIHDKIMREARAL